MKMSKQYTEKDEQRIRELNKKISAIHNGELAEAYRELFEDIYGGQCDEEYTEILSAHVLIEQSHLPVAEMRYKRIGE
jgi:hypothetical protein